MCIVSMIGDEWSKTIPERYPWTQPNTFIFEGVSKEEFEALKKEVQELKELLKAAKKFDDATGQPDCEVDEKVEFIKRLAVMLGVDMSDLRL